MPSRMGDFMKTFLGMAQIQNERNQIEDARTNARVAGLNTFMTIAKQTADPTQLTALVDRFTQLGIGSKGQLLSMLQHVTPTTETLQASQTKVGMDVYGGRTSGKTPEADALAAATAAYQLAGQTPGQLVLDAAKAKLSGSELTQGAGVSIGTRESAEGAANIDLGWGQLRQNERRILGDQALDEAALGQRAAESKRAGAPGVPDAGNISSLVSTKAGMIKQLTDTKGTPPAGLILSYIGALNGINKQLDAAGVPNEGQLPYDAALLADPGYWEAIKRRLLKQNPVVLSPNGRPTGTGQRSTGDTVFKKKVAP